MKLSENFSLSEFTKSQTATRRGIDNSPTEDHLAALQLLVDNVLQPIREKFGRVRVTSGYRSVALNKVIGGSATSQHSKGEAADFEVTGLDNFDLAVWISENLEFDQLIIEGYDGKDPNSGWIHCSFKASGNRKSLLTAKFVRGKAMYTKGLNR